MYVAIPGDQWEAVIEKVTETHQANLAMEKYYSNRKPPPNLTLNLGEGL